MGVTIDRVIEDLVFLPVVDPNTPDPNVTIGGLFPIYRPQRLGVRFWDAAGNNANRISQLDLAEDDDFDTQVWVTLSQDPGETVTLNLGNPIPGKLTLKEVGGSVGLGLADFTSGSNGTWNTRSTSHSFKVRPVQDNSDTDAERVLIRASGTHSEYGGISAGILFRIADDEAAILTNKSALTGIEGTVVDFEAKLSGEPYADVTVSITSSDETAVRIISPGSETLTFTRNNWNNFRTVDLELTPDEDTLNETVTITLSASGGGYDNVDDVTVSVVTWDITANRSIVLDVVPTEIDENGADKPFGFSLSRLPFSDVDVICSTSHSHLVFPDGYSATFKLVRDGWDDGIDLPSGSSNPRGLHISRENGNYLMVDNATDSFYEYSTETETWIRTVDIYPPPRDPQGLTNDADGNVYVVDNMQNAYFIFNPDTNTWDTGTDLPSDVTGPRGIEIDTDGGVLVVGVNSDKIYKHLDGAWTEVVDIPFTLERVTGMALSITGNLTVVSNDSDDQDIYELIGDTWTVVGEMPDQAAQTHPCLLYTSPSPRDRTRSRMPSSA